MDSFPDIRITGAFFANKMFTVALNDGRIIFFPARRWHGWSMPHLNNNKILALNQTAMEYGGMS
jgi:hypothetical protein